MWPFSRKQQPAAQPIKENIIDGARTRIIEMRDYHNDRMNYWETKAQHASKLMLDHERSFAAYATALDTLDGKQFPLFTSDEFEKQIADAADEMRLELSDDGVPLHADGTPAQPGDVVITNEKGEPVTYYPINDTNNPPWIEPEANARARVAIVNHAEQRYGRAKRGIASRKGAKPLTENDA